MTLCHTSVHFVKQYNPIIESVSQSVSQSINQSISSSGLTFRILRLKKTLRHCERLLSNRSPFTCLCRGSYSVACHGNPDYGLISSGALGKNNWIEPRRCFPSPPGSVHSRNCDHTGYFVPVLERSVCLYSMTPGRVHCVGVGLQIGIFLSLLVQLRSLIPLPSNKTSHWMQS